MVSIAMLMMETMTIWCHGPWCNEQKRGWIWCCLRMPFGYWVWHSKPNAVPLCSLNTVEFLWFPTGLAIQISESWVCFKNLVPSNHDLGGAPSVISCAKCRRLGWTAFNGWHLEPQNGCGIWLSYFNKPCLSIDRSCLFRAVITVMIFRR